MIASTFGGAAGSSTLGSGGGGVSGHGGAQLVTHQGATYLVHSAAGGAAAGVQLDDDASTVSHTAKASPVTVS